MNIQRSNETHCRSFSPKGMRQRHIQFIEFGCIYENFVWYVRMCFCMAELYVHEHRNNMAMSWTLLESMLISELADGTVAVDDAAAASNHRHLPPNQLHDGAIRCEIDLGLFCVHRNEFEFNFSVSFSFQYLRSSSPCRCCCCICTYARTVQVCASGFCVPLDVKILNISRLTVFMHEMR